MLYLQVNPPAAALSYLSSSCVAHHHLACWPSFLSRFLQHSIISQQNLCASRWILYLTWVSLNIIHEWFALWSTIEWQDLLHDNQLNWIGYDVRSCAWVEIVAEQGQRSVTTTKEMTCITITIIDIPSALDTSLDIHSIPRIQYVPILSKSTQSLISWLVVVVGRQWVAF